MRSKEFDFSPFEGRGRMRAFKYVLADKLDDGEPGSNSWGNSLQQALVQLQFMRWFKRGEILKAVALSSEIKGNHLEKSPFSVTQYEAEVACFLQYETGDIERLRRMMIETVTILEELQTEKTKKRTATAAPSSTRDLELDCLIKHQLSIATHTLKVVDSWLPGAEVTFGPNGRLVVHSA